jgi:putative ABC transport system ATP-binding protein
VAGSDIMRLVQELNNEGTTMVIVTHEESVAKACRRQIVMRDGQVLP